MGPNEYVNETAIIKMAPKAPFEIYISKHDYPSIPYHKRVVYPDGREFIGFPDGYECDHKEEGWKFVQVK